MTSSHSSRRKFLRASFAVTALAACRQRNNDSDSTRPGPAMQAVEMTPEEFKLLEDPTERSRVAGDGLLTIKGKRLGDAHRLDDASLKDIHFEDCDFVGHFMFKVNMKNVTFTRCAMTSVRWEDGRWEEVSFIECVGAGSGNNIIPGAGNGTMLYDKCEFQGDEPQSKSDIDDVELHGGIGAAGRAKFTNCHLTRMHVHLIGEGEFRQCQCLSVRIEPSRSRVPIERLLVEDCDCAYTFDLSNRAVYAVTIRNGKFDWIDMSVVKANSVVLENVTADVDILGLEAIKFRATGCTFRNWTPDQRAPSEGGISGQPVRIDEFIMESCLFDGSAGRFTAKGEPPQFDKHGKPVQLFTAYKQPIPYANGWGVVSIRKTPLSGVTLSYAHIEHMSLQDTSLSDSSITHSAIGKLELKNVKLSGTLDFTDTKVKEVVADNVTKGNLTIVRDKATELELSASAADSVAKGLRKWLG